MGEARRADLGHENARRWHPRPPVSLLETFRRGIARSLPLTRTYAQVGATLAWTRQPAAARKVAIRDTKGSRCSPSAGISRNVNHARS